MGTIRVFNSPLVRFAVKLSADPTMLFRVKKSTEEFHQGRLRPLSSIDRKRSVRSGQEAGITAISQTQRSALRVVDQQQAKFVRTVSLAESVSQNLMVLIANDEEISLIVSGLQNLALQPKRGLAFVFKSYAGNHWLMQLSRLFFVYQFSSSEVRIKAVCLLNDYE